MGGDRRERISEDLSCSDMLDGGRRGIDISYNGTSPHIPGAQPAYHPLTYLLQIPHISLLCTVCDRKIWVFVEFTKNFPNTFNTENDIVLCNLSGLGQSRLSSYQSLGEDSKDKSPSFLQHLPQYTRWDKCISRLVTCS